MKYRRLDSTDWDSGDEIYGDYDEDRPDLMKIDSGYRKLVQ